MSSCIRQCILYALSEILVHTLWIRTARWPIPIVHILCSKTRYFRPFISQWYAVATRLHLGFSSCKPAAEERCIPCHRRGVSSELIVSRSDGGMKSRMSCAWADRPVSRCRILLEGKVTWRLFDMRQKFLLEVVLTIYFLTTASIKWRSMCFNANTLTDTINELLTESVTGSWVQLCNVLICKEYLTINIFWNNQMHQSKLCTVNDFFAFSFWMNFTLNLLIPKLHHH